MSVWPYNTAQWQRVRRLKLEQNRLCEICLKQNRIEIATAVDHVISIASGGDAFPPLDKLMSCCASCHNRKTRVTEQLGKQLTVKACRSTHRMHGQVKTVYITSVVVHTCSRGIPPLITGTFRFTERPEVEIIIGYYGKPPDYRLARDVKMSQEPPKKCRASGPLLIADQRVRSVVTNS